MAGTGNQHVAYSYGMEATSELFNNMHYGMLQKGVYVGASLSKSAVNIETEFVVAPGTFLFENVSSETMSKITTSEEVVIDQGTYGFSLERDTLVARFEWANSAGNYMTFHCVNSLINESSSQNVHAEDVIICSISISETGTLDENLTALELFNTESRTIPMTLRLEEQVELDNFRAFASVPYTNSINISTGRVNSISEEIIFPQQNEFPTNQRVILEHKGTDFISEVTQTGFTAPTTGTHRRDLVIAEVSSTGIEIIAIQGEPIALTETAVAPRYLDRLVICEVNVTSERDYITPQDIKDVSTPHVVIESPVDVDIISTPLTDLTDTGVYTFRTDLGSPLLTNAAYGLPSDLSLSENQVISGIVKIAGNFDDKLIQELFLQASTSIPRAVTYIHQWEGTSYSDWTKNINQLDLDDYASKPNLTGLTDIDEVTFKKVKVVASTGDSEVSLIRGVEGDTTTDYSFINSETALQLVSKKSGTITPLLAFTPADDLFSTDKKVNIDNMLTVEGVNVVKRIDALEKSNYVEVTEDLVELTDTQSLVISPAKNAVVDPELNYIPGQGTTFIEETTDTVYDSVYNEVAKAAIYTIDAEEGAEIELLKQNTKVYVDCTESDKTITILPSLADGRTVGVYPTGGYTCWVLGEGLTGAFSTSSAIFRAEIIQGTLIEMVRSNASGEGTYSIDTSSESISLSGPTNIGQKITYRKMSAENSLTIQVDGVFTIGDNLTSIALEREYEEVTIEKIKDGVYKAYIPEEFKTKTYYYSDGETIKPSFWHMNVILDTSLGNVINELKAPLFTGQRIKISINSSIGEACIDASSVGGYEYSNYITFSCDVVSGLDANNSIPHKGKSLSLNAVAAEGLWDFVDEITAMYYYYSCYITLTSKGLQHSKLQTVYKTYQNSVVIRFLKRMKYYHEYYDDNQMHFTQNSIIWTITQSAYQQGTHYYVEDENDDTDIFGDMGLWFFFEPPTESQWSYFHGEALGYYVNGTYEPIED